jgi:hypothetical protein
LLIDYQSLALPELISLYVRRVRTGVMDTPLVKEIFSRDPQEVNGVPIDVILRNPGMQKLWDEVHNI